MKIQFWPNRKFWKIGLDKGSVAYTTTLDYHDFLDKQYFFITSLDEVNPDVESILPQWSRDPLQVTITICPNQGRYSEIYKDIKEWTRVNFFKSTYLAKNSCCGYTYWNVKQFHSITLDENTGKILKISYDLEMDVWSTYFDTFWNMNGTMEVNRMHNNRFREDTIYGSKYLIPNLINNSAIKNCDEYCSKINDKIQIGETRYLISDRTFDVENLIEKAKIDTKDGNKIYAQIFYVSKRKTDEKPYWTKIDNQTYSFKVYIFLFDNNEEISIYNQVFSYISSSFDKVCYSNIFEYCFKDEDLISVAGVKNLYYVNNHVRTEKEILYFHDEENVMRDHFFFDRDKVISEPLLNPKFEPHLASYNHTNFNIGSFGSNVIDFDLISFFFQQKKIKYPSNIHKGLFPIVARFPTITPEKIVYNQYLLNTDTTLENKVNNGLLNAKVQGSYTGVWWENQYIDFMLQNINQKEAGLNKIDVSEKWGVESAKTSAIKPWVGLAGGIGGAIMGGLLAPFTGGASLALSAVSLGASVGGMIGNAVGETGKQQTNMESIRANAKADRQSLNAVYEDAKYRPQNISREGNNEVSETINQNLIIKTGKYDKEKIFMPKISTFTLRSEEEYNVALYINKYGYPQKRTVIIDSFNDLMIRRYWNYLKISNMLEQCWVNQIPDQYSAKFVPAITEGLHFINIEYLDYDAIYRWDLNNYEKIYNKCIVELESPLYGRIKGDI